MLVSGRLQGCIESQTQEFLERLDQSGVVVDAIPEILRASLCARFHGNPSALNPVKTAVVHKSYALLWVTGGNLPSGTIKTDSLPDRVWNPWPRKVRDLMSRCDIDLFASIQREHSVAYLSDMKQYVDELVTFRNEVAHGSEPAAWTPADVRLRLRWASRLARACDAALHDKLITITGAGW